MLTTSWLTMKFPFIHGCPRGISTKHMEWIQEKEDKSSRERDSTVTGSHCLCLRHH